MENNHRPEQKVPFRFKVNLSSTYEKLVITYALTKFAYRNTLSILTIKKERKMISSILQKASKIGC
jgi:hypothetical protein